MITMARKPTPGQVKVAEEYQKWLKTHPKATKKAKLSKFDMIADEVYGR